MPTEKLKLLIEHDQKCTAFANLCYERVMLLEAYKADADESLKSANEQIYICKEQVESEKRKGWLVPVLSILGGFALGFIVTR